MVKQCQHCGVKYFCKTTRKNPFKYNGSGTYWVRHIKKHKATIKTIEIWGFDNQKDCTYFAIKYSLNNNIIESDAWSNLVLENGISGGPNMLGKKHNVISKAKMSKSHSGKILSGETKEKISQSIKSKWGIGKYNNRLPITPETKTKMSVAQLIRHKINPRTIETRQKLSAANKEFHINNPNSHAQENNGMYGKKHSPETKEKIGQKSKGRVPWNKGIARSEETKRKISETLKQKKDSSNRRKKDG